MRMKEEANRAALMAKAAALTHIQALELKEAHLKAERQRLEIETALAMANAKIKVYEESESCTYANGIEAEPKLCMPKPECYSEHDKTELPLSKLKLSQKPAVVADSTSLGARPKEAQRTKIELGHVTEPLHQTSEARELYKVMQRQTDITEVLAKNQQLLRLPQRDVPVFHGDPLEFRSFIKAFKHAIDARADSSADKLYFLEQYTRGEPKELVKSCQHMPEERGYPEALSFGERSSEESRIASSFTGADSARLPGNWLVSKRTGRPVGDIPVIFEPCHASCFGWDHLHVRLTGSGDTILSILAPSRGEGDWAAEKPVALPGQDRGNAPVSAREGVSYCEGMWGPAQCCAQDSRRQDTAGWTDISCWQVGRTGGLRDARCTRDAGGASQVCGSRLRLRVLSGFSPPQYRQLSGRVSSISPAPPPVWVTLW
ncbi:hypothetical protein MHYP_G00216430 [Metynnis hypsauchen]